MEAFFLNHLVQSRCVFSTIDSYSKTKSHYNTIELKNHYGWICVAPIPFSLFLHCSFKWVMGHKINVQRETPRWPSFSQIQKQILSERPVLLLCVLHFVIMPVTSSHWLSATCSALCLSIAKSSTVAMPCPQSLVLTMVDLLGFFAPKNFSPDRM